LENFLLFSPHKQPHTLFYKIFALFKACLQNCSYIFYDETDNMLKIHEKADWCWTNSPDRPAVLEELRALLPFMKRQHFDIVEVDLYTQIQNR
jgi:hypothetical protein